eukprot:2609475-Rhodomonas_salina.1
MCIRDSLPSLFAFAGGVHRLRGPAQALVLHRGPCPAARAPAPRGGGGRGGRGRGRGRGQG